MNQLIAAAALVMAAAAAPAVAASYDAFSAFNGTNGNGGFTYGYTDGATLTAFDTSATSGCALNGPTTCLYSSGQGNLPQASVGGTYSTVAVPADAVLVHPGNAATLSDYAGFVAPAAGSYTYTINLESVGRDTTDGTGYRSFTALGGVVTLGARALLPTFGSTGVLSGTQTLALGETFGVIVDYNTVYYGDSTGLNFTVSDAATAAVPEPAMWGLMLAGFGLVGTSMRRRPRTTVAA